MPFYVLNQRMVVIKNINEWCKHQRVYICVNAAAMDLNIVGAIKHHGGSATLAQILTKIELIPSKLPGLHRLMRVLTVLDIFSVELLAGEKNVYKLTPASRLLVRDENSLSLFPLMSLLLYPFRISPLGMGMVEWFRQNQLGSSPFSLATNKSLWEITEEDTTFSILFNNAMAADSCFLMKIVLTECSEVFTGINSLIDVAGGIGGAATTIAAAFPHLKCSLLDLPHVTAEAPSDSSVRYITGDMFQSIPPANAIFLKWILHDWGDDECIKILKNCKKAVPARDAGGKVIIIDMVVGSRPSDIKHTETQVLYDLLIMCINGVERDEHEWKKIFFASGFEDYKIISVLGVRSIIELYP